MGPRVSSINFWARPDRGKLRDGLHPAAIASIRAD